MCDQHRVFLCHNSKDKPEISKIRSFLESRDIRTFMDQYSFASFGDWEKQLESEIENFKSAAIFLGKSGLGPWQIWEIERFSNELKKRPENRYIGLVILPGYSQELLQEVKEKWPELAKLQWVDFNQEDPDPAERLIEGVSPERNDGETNRQQTLLRQRENRELRAELFQLVAGDFQGETERLLQVMVQEKVRIHEINKEMTRIIFELEGVDQNLKSAESLLRDHSAKFAEIAINVALSDLPDLKIKKETLDFQESLDWLQAELENYIERIGLSLVQSEFDSLSKPMQHRSDFSSDIYIKALNHVKEIVLDIGVEPEVYKKIEDAINTVNRIIKYR
jgi:hypothetical protein